MTNTPTPTAEITIRLFTSDDRALTSLEGTDPTLSLPTEIQISANGEAVACHASAGDTTYPDLDALCSAYGLDPEAVVGAIDDTPADEAVRAEISTVLSDLGIASCDGSDGLDVIGGRGGLVVLADTERHTAPAAEVLRRLRTVKRAERGSCPCGATQKGEEEHEEGCPGEDETAEHYTWEAAWQALVRTGHAPARPTTDGSATDEADRAANQIRDVLDMFGIRGVNDDQRARDLLAVLDVLRR